MNRFFPAALSCLVVAALPLVGGCRRALRPEPELVPIGARPDRPFFRGTERMQADLQALLAEVPTAQGAARIVLGQRILAFGEPATPILIDTLASQDATMRVFGAWLLGLTDDPRALESLDRLRQDPDESVRFEAATAMLRLGDRRALRTLVDGLGHSDPRVRSRSIQMLEQATGSTLGFRPDDHKTERDPAVARWRVWLSERESGTGHS